MDLKTFDFSLKIENYLYIFIIIIIFILIFLFINLSFFIIKCIILKKISKFKKYINNLIIKLYFPNQNIMSQIPQNQLPLSLMPNLQNINFPQTQILATEIPINLIQEEKILTQILYLSNLIQNNDLINLSIFLQENKLTKQTLQTGILLILKKYEKNNLIYQMINLLLNSGADVNSPISYYNKINIDEKDNITLLMFAIIFNDIDLIKIILNNPFIDINKIDSKNRNAIFYSVIYDNNDNNQIISLLIKNQANINSFAKIEVLNQNYEIHSIFTLACYN